MRIKSYIMAGKDALRVAAVVSLAFNAWQVNDRFHMVSLHSEPQMVRTVAHIDRAVNRDDIQDLIQPGSAAKGVFQLRAGDRITTDLPYKATQIKLVRR